MVKLLAVVMVGLSIWIVVRLFKAADSEAVGSVEPLPGNESQFGRLFKTPDKPAQADPKFER